MKDITKEFLDIKDSLYIEAIIEQRLNELTGLNFHVQFNDDDSISIRQNWTEQSVTLSGDIDIGNFKLEANCIGDTELSRSLLRAAAIIVEILEAGRNLKELQELFKH